MLQKVRKGLSKNLRVSNLLSKTPLLTQKKFYPAKEPPGYDSEKVKFGNTAGLDIVDLVSKGLPKATQAKKEHSYTIFIRDEKTESVDPFEILEKDIQSNPEFYGYKSKYPDESVEDWMKKYQDVYMDQEPPSEEFIEDTVEMSGWTREEVLKYSVPKVPDFVEYDQNGTFKNIKWENVKAQFKFDQRANAIIDSIETCHNLIAHRLESYPDVIKNIKLYDWQVKEREIGEERALYLREKFRGILKASLKSANIERGEKYFPKITEPLLNQARDNIVDYFPVFKNLSLELKSVEKQLETDEDGVPVWDYNSAEFIDTFYPEVRDRILVELDNFFLDIEYKDQFKQLSHSNMDEIYALIGEDYQQALMDETSNEFFRSYEDISLSKRQTLVTRSKIELDEKIEENNQLRQAISKLKSQLDYVEEASSTESDSKDKKSDDVKADSEKADEILRTIGIDPNGKMVIVKDWKHKPYELITEEIPEKK